MAGMLLRMGDKPNVNIMEFVVDSESEIQYLPTTTNKGSGVFENNPSFNFTAPIGSSCIVGNDGGDLLVYMLFSFGWKKI